MKEKKIDFKSTTTFLPKYAIKAWIVHLIDQELFLVKKRLKYAEWQLSSKFKCYGKKCMPEIHNFYKCVPRDKTRDMYIERQRDIVLLLEELKRIIKKILR